MARWKKGVVVVLVALLAAGGALMAQEREEGRRRWRGRFDPEQMRQRMMERLQERLGADDEEWTVIGPRLEKVMELSRELRGPGMMALFGRGRRPGGRGPGAEDEGERSPVVEAAQGLQSALEDSSADASTVKERLTEYQAAREKVRQQLTKAEQKLREVLTVRQEARLVLMGTLE